MLYRKKHHKGRSKFEFFALFASTTAKQPDSSGSADDDTGATTTASAAVVPPAGMLEKATARADVLDEMEVDTDAPTVAATTTDAGIEADMPDAVSPADGGTGDSAAATGPPREGGTDGSFWLIFCFEKFKKCFLK